MRVEELRGRIDFVILTVREDEFQAVLERFSPREPVRGGKHLYEYARVGERGVAIVRLPEQGQAAAQVVAGDAIRELAPAWIILAGIAGAPPNDRVTLGDVVLASRVHDFAVSAALEGRPPEFEQMGGPVHRDVGRLLAALPAYRERLGDWSSEASIGRPKPSGAIERAPIYSVGPVATANVLVRDPALLRRWQESARHLTHVEMEAGGAYVAARTAGEHEVPLLSVRGISDIVGVSRSPEWTAYACHAAASFVKALIASEAIELPGRVATARVAPKIAASRLPRGAEVLLGRDEELKRLEAAWKDPATHVLSIVAWGGVGKTSLVSEWVARRARAGWPGVERYFDWSFYSQGTREHAGASGDLFISEALKFFEDPDPLAGSSHDRGDRLAQLVAAKPSLLILDGLEPLQMRGRIYDAGVAALLRGLALRNNPGLCVVTTREEIADLARYHGKTVESWRLDALSEEAGAALLHRLGTRSAGARAIEADDVELKEASRAVDGHALTLELLGGYLARAHGGDVRRRDRVAFSRADSAVQGGHAARVIAAYERWLEERPLAVLRLTGLFERPADPGCLAALRRAPAIVGLTEPIVGLDEEDWNLALSELKSLGLIEVLPSLDAHPLVRAYFADALQSERPGAWKAAHARLFEHLTKTTEHRPSTLKGLQPLYQAVAHGCRAGLHQQACHEVYFERIRRGNAFFNTGQLGAFAEALAVVASFFDVPWRSVSAGLRSSDRAWMLNEAAFALRALGRLIEAVEPMRAGLDASVAAQDWKDAAIDAINLSELQLALGRVTGAVENGALCVDYADRSEDAFRRLAARTVQADALHQAGRRGPALSLFREAEAMEVERQSVPPLLCSLQGFQYCDLLLAEAERAAWSALLGRELTPAAAMCSEVARRATQALEWASKRGWLLDIALDHLTLGRCALYSALGAASARSPIEAAVDGLRKAGTMDFLPRGLLSRALLRFVDGDLDGCRADLDEAWDIAERGSMRLHMADVHLHRARLFRDRDALREARTLIEETGYHRRDEELADAEAALATHIR